MAKKKEIGSWKDAIAVIFAIAYLQSVLTVAHHTAHWPDDDLTRIVEPPAIPALVISGLLLLYSFYENRMNLTKWHIMVITTLAVSSIFWLSGLRTNFYF